MQAVFVVLGFVVVVGVVLLTMRTADPLEPDPSRPHDRDGDGEASSPGSSSLDPSSSSSSSPNSGDLRFSVVVRGYRMDEVDTVIDRLVSDVAERDAEIQRLRTTSRVPMPASPSDPSAELPRRPVQAPHTPQDDPGGRHAPPEDRLDVFGRPIPPDDDDSSS